MAQGDRPTSAYSHRGWNRDDGLPDNAAERLLLARDGWLWIGTRSGLARFDGVKFTVYDAATPGFTSDAILDLAEDAEGSLWIATKRGLYRKQGGTFTRFTKADGLPHDQVNQILPDPAGGLWLATLGGVSRLGAGRLTSWPLTETIYEPEMRPMVVHDVICLAATGSDALWLGTQGRPAPVGSGHRHQRARLAPRRAAR